ncbi:MAG: ABC transporter ATP-binding protein [Bradymonadales bacterium]|nr:ABC transporter ATP-binding protein [Bradymonadales bacterium]
MNRPAISVDGLTRRFGRFVAVDGVSFEVSKGEIFGYLGANGAGKSTTIRMLCGLLRPSAGRAVVNGHDVVKHTWEVKRSIGYMSQKFSLYLDLTVQENLQFFAGAYGLRGQLLSQRLEHALELALLTDRRNVLTGALPGGIRQRLALASALLHQPPIVFLDEPTAGVSPDARRAFWRTIRQLAHEGTTLFVTTHTLDEAEHCHRVGLMAEGRLVALDTPAELKRRHVPGALFTLHPAGGRSKELLAKLRQLEGVLEAQPFGHRLHLRIAAERDEAWLASLLEQVGFGEVGFDRTEPTLEDVFLQVAKEGAAATEGR